MQIRQARAADAEAIHAIHREAILRLCAAAYPPELIAAWHAGSRLERFQQRLSTQSFWVAEEALQVVAFGSLDLAAKRLESLFVSPHTSGCGIGGQLLATLECAAASHGVEMLRLDASLNAVGFYSRHGWTQEPASTSITLASGLALDGIPMHKKLPKKPR